MVGLKLKRALRFNNKRSNELNEKKMKKVDVRSFDTFSKELRSSECNSLQPLLTLLNLQSAKSYFKGHISNGVLFQFENKEVMHIDVVTLIGTSLKFFLRNTRFSEQLENQFIDIDINIFWEHRIEENDGSYSLDFPGSSFSFLCADIMYVNQLSKAISLAQFEYGSLWKALTASIISMMGFRISDIRLIFNNNYTFKDWCYIKVKSEWVKAWCHIDKRSKYSDRKGELRIKFYKDDKSTSKKNLICFVSDASNVEDVLLGTEPIHSTSRNREDCTLPVLNEKPLDDGSTTIKMETILASITTIGIIGHVHWTKDFLSNSPTSSRSRSSSIVGTSKSPKKRPSSKGKHFFGTHSRNVSLASSSFSIQKLDGDNFEVTNEKFLFKPVPHSGVYHLETIIRFLVPLFNCLQLYGRPTSFRFERSEVDSLSFGLPRLPTIDYFSCNELSILQNMVIPESGTVTRWSFFKSFLRDCYLNPLRQKEQRFASLADQKNTPRLLSNIQFEPFSNRTSADDALPTNIYSSTSLML